MLTKLPSGTVLAFDYCDADGKVGPRVVVLWSIRDLEKDPLSTKAVAERPDLERGQHLLKAWDLARGDYRHFYACRIKNWRVTDLHPILMVATARLRRAG